MRNTKRNTTRSSSCPWLLNFLEPLLNTLKSEGIVDGQGFERLMLKKNLCGTDLETASQLNKELKKPWWRTNLPNWPLPWEMIQNTFAIRFGILFWLILGTEILLTISKLPCWTPGVEERVATMITQSLRDMVQNHTPSAFVFAYMDKPATLY